MPEQQNIEYKQSWHDDYLKWVCGFANAQGGVIFIGKDDNGNIVGIDDYKKLMDDIPNKIRNAIGIMVEVNLHEEAGKHFIEIITHPYSVPISLRGRYYYRSGRIKELDGGFIITLFKDNITPEQLVKLGFNDRQVKAVLFVKRERTNYQ
jgi:ATP-dependent DNA helicase RecG